MTQRFHLPSLEEIILKHLHSSSPLDPDIQKLVIQESKYKLELFSSYHRHLASLPNSPKGKKNPQTPNCLRKRMVKSSSKKDGSIKCIKGGSWGPRDPEVLKTEQFEKTLASRFVRSKT